MYKKVFFGLFLLAFLIGCGNGEFVPDDSEWVIRPIPYCHDPVTLDPVSCNNHPQLPLSEFLHTYNVFTSVPLTAAAATAAGWTVSGTCVPGVGRLANTSAANVDMNLRYDSSGNLAGLQVLLHNPSGYPYDFRVLSGRPTWVADAFFRDPATICSGNQGTYMDRLTFFAYGNYLDYPIDRDEALSIGWYDTVSCIPFMGAHHVWIPKASPGPSGSPPDGPSDLILIFNLGRTQLVGFEFVNQFYALSPVIPPPFQTEPVVGPFWEIDSARYDKPFDGYSVHFWRIPFQNGAIAEVNSFQVPEIVQLQCFKLIDSPTGPTPYPYGFPSPQFPGAQTARIPVDDRWRPYDGYLNNLGNDLPASDNPTYFGIPGGYGRLAANSFADGIDTPRNASLPDPRTISNTLFALPTKLATNQINDMHSYWGQLMTADLCSTGRDVYTPMPIPIPRCDKWKDPDCVGGLTMDLNRAGHVPGTGAGTSIPRACYNEVTSYIDASWLYGSSGSQNVWLRTFENGQLNFVWYPQFIGITTPYGGNPFQRAGDIRMNKNPALVSFHLIFRREHNRRAALLQAANPTWSDEELFQNARLWTVAVVQAISTREYTAALLGEPLPPYDGYDPQVDVTLPTEFCQAGFRYGHSEINTLFMRMDENFAQHTMGHMLMRDVLWSQDEVQRSGVEPVFRGLISQQQSENDLSFIDDIRNLYAMGPYTGEDLPATNVQRGRDCGTATYNNVRAALGLPIRTQWYELTNNNRSQVLLEKLYGPAPGGLNALDLYIGGLAEDWISQSNLGETFWTIVRNQLLKIRAGDRYWYENLDTVPPGVVWTQENVSEVYLRKLEDIISDNTNITEDELGAGIFFLKSRQLEALLAIGAFNPITLNQEQLNAGFHEDTSLVAVLGVNSINYNIYWRFTHGDEVITFLIKSRTNGWLGMGFNPLPGTMKGGDLYFTRIWDNNTVEVRDSYALDVGPPRLDQDVDIFDKPCGDSLYYGNNGQTRENADSFYYGGNYTGGITSIYFSRRRAAGDQCDKPIPYNSDIELIFAFNPNTKEMKYHGPSRSFGNNINFYSGVYTILPEDETPIGLIIVLGILAGLGIVMCLVLMLLIVIKSDHFRFMAPTFCHLILIGAIVCYGAIFTLLQSPVNTPSCTVYIWMTGVGFCFMFACLFTKTFRVWRLMNSKSLKAKMVSTTDLAIWIGLLVLLEIIFLAIWTGVDKPTAENKITPYDDTMRAWYCECNDGWWGAYAGIFGAYILVGVVFTVLTRNLPPEFNDSKAIGWSMYNLFLIWVISVALGFGLEQWQAARVAIMGISIFCALTFTIIALFFTPFWRIIRGKEPVKFKSTMSLGGSSGRSSNRSSVGGSTAATDSTNED